MLRSMKLLAFALIILGIIGLGWSGLTCVITARGRVRSKYRYEALEGDVNSKNKAFLHGKDLDAIEKMVRKEYIMAADDSRGMSWYLGVMIALSIALSGSLVASGIYIYEKKGDKGGRVRPGQ